jgi:hypothetical protein
MSSRYDWSPEKSCLVDHHQEMCYDDAEAMATFTHHDTTHAKRFIEKAKRLHKIEEAERQAKTKAKAQYDGMSDRKVSIEDIEIDEIPGRDTMSQGEINRHRNLDKLKKYYSDSNRQVPESVW